MVLRSDKVVFSEQTYDCVYGRASEGGEVCGFAAYI